MTTSRIEGVGELRKALKKAGAVAPVALSAAMVAEQEVVMSVAKERTPVDKGIMRASGTVLPPEVSGTRITVASGFGGASKDYALRQHEDLSLNHTSGQPKFLESAFLERKGGMGKRLAIGVGAALKRLGR